MLDLGTSFVASVARDPDAVAIVDDGIRLTYAQWYARISSLVAGAFIGGFTVLLPTLATASRIAKKTENGNSKGGSPTAFDR